MIRHQNGGGGGGELSEQSMWTNTHIHLKSRVTLHHSSSERKVLTFNIFLLHQGMFRDKKNKLFFFFCFLLFCFFIVLLHCVFSVSRLYTFWPRGPSPLRCGRFIFGWAKSAACVCVVWNSLCLGRREARNEVCTSWFFTPPTLSLRRPSEGRGLHNICNIWVMIHEKEIKCDFCDREGEGSGAGHSRPFPPPSFDT